jgi:hypothetical protein
MRNGKVEMKRGKDYAKDSEITQAANADPRMAFSGGFGFCDFGPMPEEQAAIFNGGLPSVQAMNKCEGAQIAACKGAKRGKERKKCKKKWNDDLQVYLNAKGRGVKGIDGRDRDRCGGGRRHLSGCSDASDGTRTDGGPPPLPKQYVYEGEVIVDP